MRVISGSLKGRLINFIKNSNTRPLKDSVKESIFNILDHSNLLKTEIKNSNILDLYSGIGSFGLECLSRGSTKLTFVENYKEVLIILKKNINNLNFVKESFIIEKDVFENLNYKVFSEKFNIIFMDPPYKEKNLNLILLKILNSEILDDQGIMIIHRQKNDMDSFPEKFKIIEEKIYGISRVIFGKFN